MKRWIHASLILFLLISVVLFGATAFANSSWQWISETKPFDLLPIVAIATIFIETAAINWGGNVHRLYKVFGINILANMVSFFIPYLLNWADQVTHMKYHVFSDMIQYDHIYTVGTYYFILELWFPKMYSCRGFPASVLIDRCIMFFGRINIFMPQNICDQINITRFFIQRGTISAS